MALGYTNRSAVEGFLNRTFPEVGNTVFDTYIGAAEKWINNELGYNSRTTTSGILAESIVREKSNGKVDADGNLVIDVMHAPINFDSYGNPLVSLVEFNQGGVRVSLNLTDGTNNALNTLLEVSETGRKIIYPSLYFFPALSTVTPTRKTNLYSLKDVRFWVDISYIGGYQTVPEDIQLATNYYVADILTHRDNPNFASSVHQGSYSVSYGNKAKGTADIVSKLLQPYKRVTW